MPYYLKTTFKLINVHWNRGSKYFKLRMRLFRMQVVGYLFFPWQIGITWKGLTLFIFKYYIIMAQLLLSAELWNKFNHRLDAYLMLHLDCTDPPPVTWALRRFRRAVRLGPCLDGPGAWRLVNRFSNGQAPANSLENLSWKLLYLISQPSWSGGQNNQFAFQRAAPSQIIESWKWNLWSVQSSQPETLGREISERTKERISHESFCAVVEFLGGYLEVSSF